MTRPRSVQYADTPYLTDLDPQATIVGGRLAVSDEAFEQFQDVFQTSHEVCGGVRTYDVSDDDWQETKALELQSMGIMFVVPMIGLLSPDMAHNCTLWRGQLRPYKDQAAGVVGVPKANKAKWEAFSTAWSTASDGIDQQCAAISDAP